jgi:hypothetical protein
MRDAIPNWGGDVNYFFGIVVLLFKLSMCKWIRLVLRPFGSAKPHLALIAEGLCFGVLLRKLWDFESVWILSSVSIVLLYRIWGLFLETDWKPLLASLDRCVSVTIFWYMTNRIILCPETLPSCSHHGCDESCATCGSSDVGPSPGIFARILRPLAWVWTSLMHWSWTVAFLCVSALVVMRVDLCLLMRYLVWIRLSWYLTSRLWSIICRLFKSLYPLPCEPSDVGLSPGIFARILRPFAWVWTSLMHWSWIVFRPFAALFAWVWTKLMHWSWIAFSICLLTPILVRMDSLCMRYLVWTGVICHVVDPNRSTGKSGVYIYMCTY